MRKFGAKSLAPALLLAALCLLAVAGWYAGIPAPTQDARAAVTAPEATPPQSKTPAAQPLAEQVIALPEDAGKCHVSVFVSDRWQTDPRDQALLAWWTTHPRLIGLRVKVHYHIVIPSDPMYPRFAAAVPVVPAVMIQHPSGKVLYKASADNLPSSADALANELTRIFPLRPCPGPNCPQPKPEPKPGPPTDVDVKVNPTVPDIRPEPEPADDSSKAFVPLLIGLAVIALAGGVAVAWHQRYSG